MSQDFPGSDRTAPKQDRALQTYERLLNVAGELLAEVGIERISTNLIARRAGMTPPALYRYFKDKYAVLEALGRRLMDRQNAVLARWLVAYAPGGLDLMAEKTEELLRETHAVTRSEPGAVWILRALRAVPQLSEVRIQSHREVTDLQTEALMPLAPHLTREQIWQKVRIAVEFGYAVDEMLHDEPLVPADVVFKEAARMLSPAPRKRELDRTRGRP